jgi:hypothetical protein
MVVYLYLKSRFKYHEKGMILDKTHYPNNTLRLLQAECTLTHYQSVCTYFSKTLLRCRNATPYHLPELSHKHVGLLMLTLQILCNT